GDSSGVANALGNIGAALIALERYTEAMQAWQTALSLLKDLGARETEAYLLSNIAKFYSGFGLLQPAQDYCSQALKLARQMNLPLLETCLALQEELERKVGEQTTGE
ncbi:MAG: tetratricopeptide repeat protein, partial [Elainellaceae cyanobacterium]